jgi:hypothetical protein
MKARHNQHTHFPWSPVFTHRYSKPMVSSAMVFFLLGCASQKPAGVVQIGGFTAPEPIPLEPGSVAIMCSSTPAVFSFDKAQGTRMYSGEGAASGARSVLDPPNLNEPGLEYACGPICFVAAPFAAAYGAVKAHNNTLSKIELSASEADLVGAMESMAAQTHLRDLVLKASSVKNRRLLIPLESLDDSGSVNPEVSMFLETRIQELRLVRTGSRDDSFALHIKARGRLYRVSDRALLFDLPLQYQSSTALFLDWTYPETFRGVAETGYRELAAHITEQMFSNLADGPVLSGAGYKKRSPRSTLVVNRLPLNTSPGAQFAAFSGSGMGQLGVYSTGEVMQVTLQRPLQKEEAQEEALSDVAWSLDGLQYSRNSIVQLSACAAAIPLSLWKQTVAAVRGLSSKQYQHAEAQLSAAARAGLPHEELANQVAQQLAPRTAQPVALVRKPPIAETEDESTVMRCMARGTLAWLPPGQTPTSYLEAQGTDSALEIHVLSAALKGKSGINPPLAVCVEAEATLYRVRDGAEVYSFPILYRSEGRKFVDWAANDAKLFREELNRCYQKMGDALVEKLVERGVLTPNKTPRPTLATN